MTLPIELLRRRGASQRYDVVVVGAGVAGLTCGAVLARGGLRVVVLDPAKRPGGRLQTVAYQGFAVDIGALTWSTAEVDAALAAAGVRDLAIVELPVPASLKLATATSGGVVSDPCQLPCPGAVTSPRVLDAVRSLYGVAPRIFAGLGELYQELAAHGQSQATETPPSEIGLDAWLAERRPEPAVAAAFKRSLVLLGSADPERADLSTVARRVATLSEPRPPSLAAPGDNPIAGARGLIQAMVDALIERGGELRLGTRATGMAIERGRFRSLAVQREEQPFADELVAERCVLAVPPGDLWAVLPAPVFASVAPSLADVESRTALGVAWAFRAPPESRTGGPAPEPGVLRLVAAPQTRGQSPPKPLPPTTLVWCSAHAPRVVPPDHALLIANLSLDPGTSSDAYQVGLHLAFLRAVLRDLYRGIDDLLLWEHHWLVPGGMLDPFARLPLATTLPGVEGLSLAGAAVAVAGEPASGIAAAALSGLRVAERILAAV